MATPVDPATIGAAVLAVVVAAAEVRSQQRAKKMRRVQAIKKA